jgi:hypothetical protein
MASQTLTDEERAKRRARERELVRESVERLRSSGGWQQWLRTRSRFRSYSFGNQLLIAHQHPTATRVAGFRAWLALGYCVQKGEHSIRIWAPCPPTRRQLERWEHDGADPASKPRMGWRLAAVFDRLSRVCPDGAVRGPSGGGFGWRRRPRGFGGAFTDEGLDSGARCVEACVVVAEPVPVGRRCSGCARYGR